MQEKNSPLEISALTVDEAIEEGLAKLGLPEEAVEIEILDEGAKGILGIGARDARVRIAIKGEEPSQIQDASPSLEEDHPEESDLEEDQVLQISRETVSELIEKMNIRASVAASYGQPDEDGSRPPVYIDITGKDLSILIGKKAETLNALQFIARLIIGKELEQSVPLVIDVEGYRKRRELQLQKLALRVAEQVSETGRSQALEPMPPNERRLVHIALREHPEVYTESVDSGNRRKVVIFPKD